MLKQILSKIPRKSSRSETTTDSSAAAADNNSNNNPPPDGFPFTNSCNVVSVRLNAIKRMSSSIFPASLTTTTSTTNAAAETIIDPDLPFKNVSNSDKQNLFIAKLNFCSSSTSPKTFDFIHPDKDLKRKILIDLVEFVGSDSAKFTESSIESICKMCSSNLFRSFPPKSTSHTNNRTESDDEDPIFDPAWTHLQLVYDILLRFINSNSLDIKLAKKFINHSFISKLLDLFESDDPRERDCLKTILHRVYGKFMVHRPFIRKSVSNVFYRFVIETERHNGIAELLEIFGSVISGFAVPLKEEHRIFLCRALIPLHKPKTVGIYHQQLTYCIVQFVEKDPKLVSYVIKGILKYWPVTNTQKQLMFLSELEELLEMINIVEFEKVAVPLFSRIRSCLNSSHFQVAERAHFMWNNDHVLKLIMQNRSMFSEVDEELVIACRDKIQEEDSKSVDEAERRRLTWERLEITALGNISACIAATC
ncbi:serine/threonine protein phosphatase 2A 57 kDa regulatory subunit B' kappa isoform-like isoform X2 [Impatiens glandulifera]|uniref:serine/threonine protein phosphatase 2A 57 kDa regulatory subunit B' kappa isoform-like isoform X2 n=1 Tax=Impatiens glandulifera TaxID=253017 RepID=UPI001FB06B99|nr:serine/threonine protein phosphatase 2A 57 kDa regulatory subunit B' kappa isoform-like isoform X2 [Impatiens glandulifera]